jgi:hypothetical protein
VSRAGDQSNTLRPFRLSELRHQHGWGEQRIRDAWARASPDQWTCYPTPLREVTAADRSLASTRIDFAADTASVWRGDGSDPLQEITLFLPVDVAGKPVFEPALVASPAQDAASPSQATGAKTVDKIGGAKLKLTCADWLKLHAPAHPKNAGETVEEYHARLAEVSGDKWTPEHIKNTLSKLRNAPRTKALGAKKSQK